MQDSLITPFFVSPIAHADVSAVIPQRECTAWRNVLLYYQHIILN